jgi:hypothetical protein
VVNPDIHLVDNVSTAVPITIHLYGGWFKVDNKPAKYASVISSTTEETLVQFTAADGLPAEIVLARTSAALPLRSLSLDGRSNEAVHQNELTMKEENDETATYYLENKAGENGGWQVIDEKQLQGAVTEQSYIFYHHNPFPATNFYRIKWLENAGNWKYSNIVQLKNAQANAVTVAPNPARDFFSVTLKQKPLPPVSWTLADAGGKVVRRGKISDTRTDISVNGFPAGVYFFSMDNAQSFRIAVIK